MNWIVPDKFLAFSGPSDKTRDSDGWRTYTPEDYAPLFKNFNIKLVVRCNKEMYAAQRFVKKGFEHLDLYFTDGTPPPDDIVK